MKTLPFVVQPKREFKKVKIGSPEIGVIEIERRGYITVSEKAFVDAITQGTDGIAAIVNLATRISAKTKHSTEESFNAIMMAVQNNFEDAFANKIRSEYPDELGSIISQMGESMVKRNIAATTILIQSRIDEEWTLDDTLNLDPSLMQAFADFYAAEEVGLPVLESEGITTEDEESKPEDEAAEIVGKSTEENGENQ